MVCVISRRGEVLLEGVKPVFYTGSVLNVFSYINWVDRRCLGL